MHKLLAAFWAYRICRGGLQGVDVREGVHDLVKPTTCKVEGEVKDVCQQKQARGIPMSRE